MKKQNINVCRTQLAAAIVLALGSTAVSADPIANPLYELGNGDNNFTMLTPAGGRVGGTNDVMVMWDFTLNTDVAKAVTNMTISATNPFFGVPWFAHDVQVFAPGEYTFEACPGPIDEKGKAADGSTGCGGGSAPQTMLVGDGQVGVHMLFDWNSSVNIDVVNVWDMNAQWGFGPNDGTNSSKLETELSPCFGIGKKADLTTPECVEFFGTEWLFTASDPDGNGVPGSGMVDGPFRGFNAAFNVRPEVVPVPAAVWLMGSGLLGLVGVARRRKL